MTSTIRRPDRRLLSALTLALAGSVSLAAAAPSLAHGGHEHALRAPDRAERGVPGGAFELVSHQGGTVTDRDFRGRYLLVYFGYTRCSDICPVGLAVMATVMRELGDDASRVQPLFITVDPERDSAGHLAGYVPAFHPSLIGLTGDRAQIHRAATAYRVAYFAGEIDGRYVVDHSGHTYLMGPDGAFIESFPHGTGVGAIAARLRQALAAGS